jgi:hypothetical protein
MTLAMAMFPALWFPLIIESGFGNDGHVGSGVIVGASPLGSPCSLPPSWRARSCSRSGFSRGGWNGLFPGHTKWRARADLPKSRLAGHAPHRLLCREATPSRTVFNRTVQDRKNPSPATTQKRGGFRRDQASPRRRARRTTVRRSDPTTGSRRYRRKTPRFWLRLLDSNQRPGG